MKAILCLAAMLLLFSALTSVTWSVVLFDSFGDGWNGGTISVYVNGTIVLNSLTLASGYGPQSHPFIVQHGDQVTTLYTPGSWSYENEYRLINQNMVTVHVSGEGDQTPPSSLTAPVLAEVLNIYSHPVGTQTNIGVLPVYPWFYYSYSQSIYLRSELPSTLGYNRISKLRYHWNGVASATNSLSWTVYIGHTTLASFANTTSWVPLSQLTQVFSGNVSLLATAGWIEITLDRPFEYDGTSNLVVAVDENTRGYDASNGRFFQTAVANYRSLASYSDVTNPDPASPPAALQRLNQIPNIIFDLSPLLYPPKMEDFSRTNIPRAWTQGYSNPFTSNFWLLYNTSSAGGSPNEMRANWRSGTGTSRLISPPVTTSGVSMLQIDFYHFFDDFAPGLTAKLQYSHDLINWMDAGWSLASGGGNQSGHSTIGLAGPFQDITYIAWTLEGDHFQFDFWCVDNVIISRDNIDARVVSIDNPEVVDLEPLIPLATVQNQGDSPATFQVTYSIGNGNYANTQWVNNLAPGATQQVTFAPFATTLDNGWHMRVTTHLANDMNFGNDRLEQLLWFLDLDTQAYVDVHHYSDPNLEGPSTFNLKTPGTVTHLGSPSATELFMAGADWIGNHWYGTEWSSSSLESDRYWRIDHNSGAQTYLGDNGVPIHGIAWDPIGQILYGTDLANLYTLNRYTGIATLVGSHVNCVFMIGLAFDHNINRLYGVDLVNDNLYWINTATGLANEIGSLGIPINFGQDLAFDRDKGYLFLAGYNGGYRSMLYWIRPATGQAFKIGDFPTNTHMVGFAIPYDAGIPDVSISANGTLSWDPIPGATEYKIYGSNTPYAATFTYMGSTPSTSWLEPGGLQSKRFYKVTAITSTRDGTFGEPVLRLDIKDPLTGELLDPQPPLPKAVIDRAAWPSDPPSAGLAP
ncbi:MAG: hypothetical protein K0B87_00655 [Candidatus Syntrophosphaera sp.]|nr:hypothetical protein [Candidatus Syntrophosphaera sp.]